MGSGYVNQGGNGIWDPFVPFLDPSLPSQERADFDTDSVTAGLLSTTAAVSTTPSAGFVAGDGSVTFALNIPQNDTNNDLYFTIFGPSSSSWIVSL